MSEFVALLQNCLLAKKPNNLIKFIRVAHAIVQELALARRFEWGVRPMKHLRLCLVLVLAMSSLSSSLAQGAEAPESSDANSIGYASVEEALKALKAKPGVTFRTQDGWVVAEDMAVFTTWLFTPFGHPAYPSMVKRAVVNKADGAHMQTSVRCFASKEVCDNFFGSK